MDWLHFSGNAEMDVKMSSIFQIMFLKMILKFVVTKIAKDDLWVRNCKSFLRRKAKKKSELWKPVIRLAEQYPPSFITATAKRSEWKVGRRQKKNQSHANWKMRKNHEYYNLTMITSTVTIAFSPRLIVLHSHESFQNVQRYFFGTSGRMNSSGKNAVNNCTNCT